jgi:hypothetical protein
MNAAELDEDCLVLCRCGCAEPARPGSAFASTQCSNKHRRKTWDEYHPRLDLSGLPLEVAKRCQRMAEEAVRAAREGLERATVDARLPVQHGRDPRPSCRVRIPRAWDKLEEMVGTEAGEDRFGIISASALVENLIAETYERWKGGGNAAQEGS